MRPTKYLIVCVIALLQVVALAEDKRKQGHHYRTRLVLSHPTVYLTFDGMLDRPSGAKDPELMLTLHNNTRWLIHYHLRPSSIVGKLLPVLYGVERETGTSDIELGIRDVILGATLRPGAQVKFTVPSQHLSVGFNVYVEFNYDWERVGDKALFTSEPVHRAYLHNYDLPKEQQR